MSYAIHEQNGRGQAFLWSEKRDRAPVEKLFRAWADHYPTKRIKLVEITRNRRGPVMKVLIVAGYARAYRQPREEKAPSPFGIENFTKHSTGRNQGGQTRIRTAGRLGSMALGLAALLRGI